VHNRPGETNPIACLFNGIARWYDFLNHFLSAGQDVYWRKRQVRGLRVPPMGRVLDLAAGTMDVSREILRRYPGVSIIAMDVSSSMLVHGRAKIPNRHANAVTTVLGDGRMIPLPSASMDSVTISFGIRNITPRSRAYEEILRILKPGGKLSILEFGTGRERIWGGMYNFYLDRILPLLGRLVSRDQGAYRYLAETIKTFPDAPSLARELHEAGFGRIMYQPLSSGIVYLHTAEKPGAENVRRGDQLRAI
jgi:demethylmenaquinone methyltransferase/2-methoxy-6-polyprenyl-1,4-benzoquinol methylase